MTQKALYKKGDFIGQKYEVYDVLGMGGFGIVYLVYSHETESAYALKTFREEYIEDITSSIAKCNTWESRLRIGILGGHGKEL